MLHRPACLPAGSLVLLAGSFLLVSCTGENSPKGAVKAFLAAGRSGNRARVLEMIQRRDRAFLEKMQQTAGKTGGEGVFVPPEGAEFRIGQETIDGDRGTVVVTTIQDGREKTDTVRLLREDGKWRIDLVADEMLDMLDDPQGILKGITGSRDVTGSEDVDGSKGVTGR